jgi:hypothetical protein
MRDDDDPLALNSLQSVVIRACGHVNCLSMYSWRIAVRRMRALVAEASGARGQRSASMKSRASEKVSIADVQPERESQRRQLDDRAWVALRAPQRRAVLLDTTTLWMAELPQAVRPIMLARKFPRIANSIAELWRRVARCEEYLDSLVVDLRGNRTGFPPEVAQELTALRSHFAELHPHDRTAWDLVRRD